MTSFFGQVSVSQLIPQTSSSQNPGRLPSHRRRHRACQCSPTILRRSSQDDYYIEKPPQRDPSRLSDVLRAYSDKRGERAKALVSFSSNYAKVHTGNLLYGLGPLVRKLIYAYLPEWGWMWGLRWLYGYQPTVDHVSYHSNLCCRRLSVFLFRRRLTCTQLPAVVRSWTSRSWPACYYSPWPQNEPLLNYGSRSLVPIEIALVIDELRSHMACSSQARQEVRQSPISFGLPPYPWPHFQARTSLSGIQPCSQFSHVATYFLLNTLHPTMPESYKAIKDRLTMAIDVIDTRNNTKLVSIAREFDVPRGRLRTRLNEHLSIML